MSDTQIGVTRRAAHALVNLELSNVPVDAVVAGKRLLLDTLLVAWAGTTAEGAAAARALVRPESGGSTVWGTLDRRSASGAAFANAVAASALEFDSLNDSVHADAVVIPALLAVAEQEHSNGRDFLLAYISAAELVCRLGLAARRPQKGWSPTTIYGVFGAALGASRLLRLDAEGSVHALGLCLSMAAGSQQTNVEQTLSKRMQPGIAARNGVFASMAAQAGITAPVHAFEGRFGLWSLYQEADAEVFMSGMGRDFAFAATGLKKYPVCACSHSAMEASLGLVRENTLQVNDIDEIVVVLSPFMERLVGGGFRPEESPQVTAQFSIEYALASILLRGALDVSHLDPAAVADPSVTAIANRVRIIVDSDNDGELAPVTVRIRSHRLGWLERTEWSMPGTAEAPLSETALQAKLASCARGGLSAMGDEQLTRLQESVSLLENVDDMSEFVSTHLRPTTN